MGKKGQKLFKKEIKFTKRKNDSYLRKGNKTPKRLNLCFVVANKMILLPLKQFFFLTKFGLIDFALKSDRILA